MQIPLTYCDDIIGVGGSKIAHIRRTSGAILTVQESMGLPDEITVEIKGNSAQVQVAQQLIQVSGAFFVIVSLACCYIYLAYQWTIEFILKRIEWGRME